MHPGLKELLEHGSDMHVFRRIRGESRWAEKYDSTWAYNLAPDLSLLSHTVFPQIRFLFLTTWPFRSNSLLP